MKVCIANYEPNRIGGGWSFMNNFVKGMGDAISNYAEADTYFICGPTMVERSEVEQAKKDGKKVVFRIDNAVRNSRNRNTGMPRMKDYAEWADLVVYQSKWARDYLLPFTGVDGPVILNGVDQSVFKPLPKKPNTYLYSRQNRDETKNWEVARYYFSQLSSANCSMWIVGNFSPELVEGNFDFFMDEDFTFYPTQAPDAYALLVGQAENFIYTYYNDACSNSLIEAIACGCKIVDPHHFLETGGAPEILEQKDVSLERMIKQYEYELGRL